MTTRKAPDDCDHRLNELVRVAKSLRPGTHFKLYEGAGDSAAVRKVFEHDGSIATYEGAAGQERLVSYEYTAVTSGHRRTHHYQGPHGKESLEKCVHWHNGMVTWYKGEKDKERKHRVDFLSGVVVHFEGAPKKEARVRQIEPNGNICWFEGNKGSERITACCNVEDGAIKRFRGSKGKERLFMFVHSNGRVTWYDTSNNNRNRLRSTLYTGQSTVHYTTGDANPLGRVHRAHTDLKEYLTETLTQAERMATEDKCNEHVFHTAANWLMEINKRVDQLAKAGTNGISYHPVRLNGDVRGFDDNEEEEGEEASGDEEQQGDSSSAGSDAEESNNNNNGNSLADASPVEEL